MRGGAPSVTARLIASGTVLLSKDPRWSHLVPPLAAEASEWLLEAWPFERMCVRLAERRWFRALLRGLERAILPGLLLHYALRKRYLEQVARTPRPVIVNLLSIQAIC